MTDLVGKTLRWRESNYKAIGITDVTRFPSY
jgi:hypothetical protein